MANAVASDWQDVLTRRTTKRGPNVLRVKKDSDTALLDAPSSQTSIDEDRRCVTFVISTPTPDRSEDVVVPTGVILDNYKRNPVVFYDHGFSGIATPIGKCEDETGEMAIVVTDQGIEGTVYFANSTEGEQIFQLVKDNVLRAASINLQPKTYTIRSDDTNTGRPGMQIDEWELLEWSVVGIPDNPEAIRKILAGGKLAGQPICDSIKKSLLRLAPTPKLLGKHMTDSIKKDGDDDTDSGMSMGADGTISGNPGMDESEGADGGDDVAEKPPGAKCLEKCHGMLKSVCKELEADLPMQEHEQVKACMKGLHEAMQGHCEEIRNCYKDAYPDQGEDGLDAEDDQPELDAKSALRLLACCSNLRDVRGTKGLDTKIVKQLQGVEARINDIYRQSQKRKPVPSPQVTVSGDVGPVLELLNEFNGLVKEMRDSVPRRAVAGRIA